LDQVSKGHRSLSRPGGRRFGRRRRARWRDRHVLGHDRVRLLGVGPVHLGERPGPQRL